MALAACAASATGRTARRAAKTPSSTPSAVVITLASRRERATLDSVRVVLAEGEELEVGADLGEGDAEHHDRLPADIGDHPRRHTVLEDALLAVPRGSIRG